MSLPEKGEALGKKKTTDAESLAEGRVDGARNPEKRVLASTEKLNDTDYGPSASTQYNTTAQYYPPAQYYPTTADTDYAAFMAQHGGQVAPHVVYEAKRATRQMAHYFDVSQYKTQLDQGTAPVPPDPKATLKKRPTKKELEQFKKRKEERKRIRNRWLFE